MSHRLFSDALVCIPDDEDYAEYLASGFTKKQLLVHSSKMIGIAPKRNWILQQFQNEPVFMVDDDMESFHRVYGKLGQTSKIKEVGAAQEVINNLAQMTHDMGAFMFGLGCFPDPKLFGVDKPFAITGFIPGAAMGLLPGHGLSFDTQFLLRDDFDICCMNAFRHRICLKENRFTFSTVEMYKRAGGQATYRTGTVDGSCIERLILKYGSDVIMRSGVMEGPVEKIKMVLPY